MFDAVEWTRPAGLWLLLLPALLLLLTRLNSRPQSRATGTLALWKQVAAQHGATGSRSWHRIPLATWVLAAALTLGALAVADPYPRVPARAQLYRCALDTSPSMFLPLAGSTRIGRAIELACIWLETEAKKHDVVEWVRWVDGRSETARASAPPTAWLEAPRAPQPEPPWSDLDSSGSLWLTDRAEDKDSALAVLIATGGEAVRGPIATSGTTRYDWDTERIVEVAQGAERGRLLCTVEARERLAVEILEFAQVWAASRDFVLVREAEQARLELRSGAGVPQPVALGQEGWLIEGTGRILPEIDAPQFTAWLRQGALEVVRSAPGVVECGLARIDRLAGDRAAFAVSWSELFDGAVLPAPGVIALDERVAAGEELVRAPSAAMPQGESRRDAIPPAAWLATGALVLALLASLLGLRTLRVRS